jgi:hypothetical protein
MARPMEFRVLAALSSRKMPDGCRFLVSVCIAASASAINTTSRPDWKLDIRPERALPFEPNRALPSCIGGSRAAPPEDCAGALDYLKRLDWHRSHLPIDELNIMVEAIRRFLDSDGDRHAIGDLEELREAVDRVKAYQDFQPDKFDRRELNRRLRGIEPRS